MRRFIENVMIIVVFVFLLASLAGFFLDRPVLVSYAYSDSMTPTIDRGDLFFMNPFAGNFEVGDVIVFHRRDGWTVHRIFAVTESGFITKGDNNVATDQQDGLYPTVKREDVAGKVITLGGNPLVIRGGGSFVQAARKRLVDSRVVVLLLITGAFATFSGGKERRAKGNFVRIRVRTLYAVVSVVVVASFLFVTVASWGTLAFTYSSTLAGGQREGWYLPGSAFERNLSLENNAVYPFYYFLSGGSERVQSFGPTFLRIPGSSNATVSVHVAVPEDTRVYREELQVRSYPALLPSSLVVALYSLNPYLPLVAYSLLISAVLLAFYRLAGISEGDVIRIRKRRGSFLSKVMGDG